MQGVIGILFAASLMLGGCGAMRMTPVDPQSAGGMKPQIDDTDAGLVVVTTAFNPDAYAVLIVEPFKINTANSTGDDAQLATGYDRLFSRATATTVSGGGRVRSGR